MRIEIAKMNFAQNNLDIELGTLQVYTDKSTYPLLCIEESERKMIVNMCKRHIKHWKNYIKALEKVIKKRKRNA